MSLTRIKVTRAFCIQGEPQKVGSVLEVEQRLAVELVSYAKAELSPDDGDKDAGKAAPTSARSKKEPQQ
jgi:hypothetical protein